MVRHKKKGIVELILVMVLLLVFVFVLFIAKSLNTTIAASGIVNSTYMEYSSSALGVFNEGYIIILVGAIIAIVIGAIIIWTHPIFAIPYMVVMLFVIMLAAIFTNTLDAFTAQEGISDAAGAFPMITQSYAHWPLIMLVACVIIIVAYFAKGGGQS